MCLLSLSQPHMMTVHDKPSPVRHCTLLMHCITQNITPLLACNVQNKGVKNSPHESYLLAKSLAAVYHPPPVIHERHGLK